MVFWPILPRIGNPERSFEVFKPSIEYCLKVLIRREKLWILVDVQRLFAQSSEILGVSSPESELT